MNFEASVRWCACTGLSPAGLIVGILALAPGFLGCGRKQPVEPGGGSRVVTGITLSTAYGKASFTVGEAVPLRVRAHWAIPSETDETRNAVFEVRPAGIGEITDGVFRPKKQGAAVLVATYSGFRSELQLEIREGAGTSPAAAGLQIRKDKLADGVTLVTLQGALDDRAFQELEAALHGLFDAGAYKLIVDLSAIEYVEGGSLGVLMDATGTARQHEGNLILIKPTPSVMEVIQVLKLEDVLTFKDTREDALEALRSRAK